MLQVSSSDSFHDSVIITFEFKRYLLEIYLRRLYLAELTVCTRMTWDHNDINIWQCATKNQGYICKKKNYITSAIKNKFILNY